MRKSESERHEKGRGRREHLKKYRTRERERKENERRAGGMEEERVGGLGRKAGERSDLQVKLLKYQVDELERHISEVKLEGAAPAPLSDTLDGLEGGVAAEASSVSSASVPGGLRRRPITAGADGLDRRRTASERWVAGP